MALLTRFSTPLIDEPSADEELRVRVSIFLQQRGHRPLQQLEIEACNGVVTLRGTVPSFYVRQHALACVRHVAGILQVIDEMEMALLLPAPDLDGADASREAGDSALAADTWRS